MGKEGPARETCSPSRTALGDEEKSQAIFDHGELLKLGMLISFEAGAASTQTGTQPQSKLSPARIP